MNFRFSLSVLAAVLVGAALAMVATPTQAQAPAAGAAPPTPATADQVDAAVEKGLKFLWSKQGPNGRIGGESFRHGGEAAVFLSGEHIIAMTTLAYAGEPLTKPEMRKAFAYLQEAPLNMTYTLGFRVITLAEMYRHADDKARPGMRQTMKQDVDKLVTFQVPNGGWGYSGPQSGEGDFSNTQVAMLALQQAVSCGVEVKPEVFMKLLERYLTKQRDDGGWNYGRTDSSFATQASYGSMTAAAVANLYLIRDILSGATGCPCKGDSSPSRRNAKIDEAIKRGFKWLGDKFSDEKGANYYWFYSVERVGIATGYKYLGQHDWYAEGATAVIQTQKADGSFGGGDTIPDTCFALLFLIKGRGPVLMNKLEFDGEWDRHPHDAEKVSEYIAGLKEQRINWQVINLNIPVEEMHDSPIMYITAESALKLTDEHKKKLREFTDTGGTILFEASCGNNAANVNWKLICKTVWPEWELKLIDKNHPLWTADAKIVANKPLLQTASDGVRTFLFYTPKDISCFWTTMAIVKNQAAFDMVGNLYVYASDHSKLRSKLAGHEIGVGKKYADEPVSRGAKDAITVTRVKHGGDWYAAQNYHSWELLARSFQAQSGMPAPLAIKETEPVAPGEAIPAGTNLLYLSGRTGCDLGANGGPWLKDFATSGGFIFAEAVTGDKRFDELVRPALEAAGFALKPLPADHPLLSGQLGNGAKGYSVTKPGYSFSLRPERIGQSAPSLVGLYLGDKLVGVYSPFDIMFSQTGCVAFGNRGYAAEDARALATNIALRVSASGPAAAAPKTAE